MRPEYDFSKMKLVGQGLYVEKARKAFNLIKLDPEIEKSFPDSEAVNEALRMLLKLRAAAGVQDVAHFLSDFVKADSRVKSKRNARRVPSPGKTKVRAHAR